MKTNNKKKEAKKKKEQLKKKNSSPVCFSDSHEIRDEYKEPKSKK